MKKTTIILVSMLLVFTLGQTVFAKNQVGLTFGYNKMQINATQLSNEIDLFVDGFKIGVNGNYYLTDKFSLSGGFSLFKGNAKFNMGDISINLNDYGYMLGIDLNLFGRYDLYKTDVVNAGIQLGIINNNILIFASDDLLADTGYEILERIGLKFPLTFVALGAYGNANLLPELNVYADLKFPIGFQLDIAGIKIVSYLKEFFYDITLGATYEVSPNINIGIEGNINNTNVLGVLEVLGSKYIDLNELEDTQIKNLNFSIGAKIGYSF